MGYAPASRCRAPMLWTTRLLSGLVGEIPRQILNELTMEAGGWLLILVHPRVVGREISCRIFAQAPEDLPRLILFALELLDGGPAGAALGQADKGSSCSG